MVVLPEPAVKGGGAFLAFAGYGVVGPAGEHRADEALGFAVGLGSAWPCAQVADPQSAAGERVERGDVGAAVVGQDPLDLDPVAAVVGEGAAQEADRGRGFLVCEYLGVGEAAVVVDGDVHVFVAGGAARRSCRVAQPRGVVLRAAAHAPAGAADDPAELLDVDVDELPWPGALVADNRLEPEAAQATNPGARQDPR